MLDTRWYTSECTNSAMNTPPSPKTLSEWRTAYRAGARPEDLLAPRLAALRQQGAAPDWISLADESQLAAQLGDLAQRARAFGGDVGDLLAAMPLYGVPFAVKDNIDVAGLTTTAACPAFARTAARHASAVERLVAAGAVWFGKTNLDQFATGLVGARSPYGRPSSVFAPDRISGGSSSGSAVVVARADVAFSLGTDTAGSGRVPAGFNQIVGLKPTPGRVGTSGLVPACRSLDCVSVFALSVADAAEVLAVIEGPDEEDAYSDMVAGPSRWADRPLRIGIPIEPVFSGDAGYAPEFDRAVARLQSLGHTVTPIDFRPLHAVAELLYGGPWVAERDAAVQPLLTENPGAFDPVVRQVIEVAKRFDATDAFRGQYTLRAAKRDTATLWQSFDLLMVPTAPGHPRHADIDADPIGGNAILGTYTNFVNLLGWCALALPSSTTSAGLPFGVTFLSLIHI